MTNKIETAWWNLPVDELEQMADKDGKIKLSTKIKTTNPYSGQSEMLTKTERDLYYEIKRAEDQEEYDTMQKGLDKFSRLNPKAYMRLLD